MNSERIAQDLSAAQPAFISLDPEDAHIFMAQLFSNWRETFGFGCKSVYNRDIDLYGDLIERNLAIKEAALRWWDRDELVSVTYSQIAEEVDILATLWLSNSVRKGESLCIVCSHPYRRIISLLCGFRLGLVPLLIDPTGPVVVKTALDANPCTYIHVDPDLTEWVPDDHRSAILRLTDRSTLNGLDSHRCPVQSVILRLTDSFSGNAASVIDIKAQDLFLRLIRDGIYILKLGRGTKICASTKLHDASSPIIELTTFICGAGLTILDDQPPAAQLNWLMAEPFDLIRISRAMIESLMLAHQRIPRSADWKRWYRSPLEAQHVLDWQNFKEQLKLQNTPYADLHWATPVSGIAFGSEWSTDLYDFDLYPVPGQSWFLGDMASPETQTKGETGRLVIQSENEEKPVCWPTPFILSKAEKAYRFLGCYPSGRFGLAFPEELVSACLASDSSWHTIVEIPVANGSHFVLLAFMDSRTKSELHKIITNAVGDFALPDQIEIIPYVPKITQKGAIDSEWAKRLYISGEFTRRRSITIYTALSNVKMLSLPTPQK